MKEFVLGVAYLLPVNQIWCTSQKPRRGVARGFAELTRGCVQLLSRQRLTIKRNQSGDVGISQ